MANPSLARCCYSRWRFWTSWKWRSLRSSSSLTLLRMQHASAFVSSGREEAMPFPRIRHFPSEKYLGTLDSVECTNAAGNQLTSTAKETMSGAFQSSYSNLGGSGDLSLSFSPTLSYSPIQVHTYTTLLLFALMCAFKTISFLLFYTHNLLSSHNNSLSHA